MDGVRAKVPSGTRVIGPQEGPQTAWLQCRADIAFFGGSAGSSKTYGLLLDPLRYVNVRGFGAVIFRRTTKQLLEEGSLWDAAGELYPICGARSNYTRFEWKFPSGTKISFAHMEHEQDRFAWDGSQIAMIGFDQVEHFTEKQFWYMLSRNRSMCGVKPYMRATCNPVPDDDTPGGWVHILLRDGGWIDPVSGLARPERSGVIRYFLRTDMGIEWGDTRGELTKRYPDSDPMSFTFIPAKLEDNKILLDRDPRYRARLASLPLVDRMRLRDANWNAREQAGMFFQRDWFEIIDVAPASLVSIRYWDRAATEDDPKASWTAGCHMGRDRDGVYYILDMSHFQARPLGVKQKIKNNASQDGKRVYVGIEQDPGQAGVADAQVYVRELAGYTVKTNPVHERKGIRARPLSAQVEGGNVKLVRGLWNEAFLKEADHFDGSDKCRSDQIDAASGAFYMLTTVMKKRGAWVQTL